MKILRNEDTGRLARILRLTELLRERSDLTREEIASELDVTVRQFYVDKAALARAGFIFNWNRSAQRHVIESDPFRETTSLSYQESVSLAAAVQVLDRSGEKQLAQAAKSALSRLLKIGTVDSPQLVAVREMLSQVTAEKTQLSGISGKSIEYVASAMVGRKQLTFDYNKPEEHTPSRKVEVYSIFAGGQDGVTLYADAWDITKEAYRTFRVSRMRNFRLGRSFAPRPDYSFSDRARFIWQVTGLGENPETVRLYVEPKVADQLGEQQRHFTQEVTKREDGSLDLSFQVSSPREVLWWSFLWQGYVRVLEPKWLVKEGQEIVARLKEAYLPQDS